MSSTMMISLAGMSAKLVTFRIPIGVIKVSLELDVVKGRLQFSKLSFVSLSSSPAALSKGAIVVVKMPFAVSLTTLTAA